MKMSLTQAAIALGKSPRQLRYMIKAGQLRATKRNGRWIIDEADLPVSAAKRSAMASRAADVRRQVDEGLQAFDVLSNATIEPPAVADAGEAERGAADAERTNPRRDSRRSGHRSRGKRSRKPYSVQQLRAFDIGCRIAASARAALGTGHPACTALAHALKLIARGCHSYHPTDKAQRYFEARERACDAVVELLVDHRTDTTATTSKKLAADIEAELLPKLGRLVAGNERRLLTARLEEMMSRPDASARLFGATMGNPLAQARIPH